ncbi:MAG: TIGR02556 family CRISPR-associated protein [Thermodesulfovibrionales bacterium]
MLSAIKEIGELVAVEEQVSGKILFINLDTVNSKYTGIEIEDFDLVKHKSHHYLYKAGASRGNVSAPFCPITKPKKGDNKKEGETTYEKIKRWLEQCNQTEDSLINRAFESLSKNREIITSELEKKIKDLPKKKGEGRFLSLKLDKKYLGEYGILRDCLMRSSEDKLKRSAGSGVCSICGLPDKQVSGKTDVFKFYTIDKPGFITGGFKESIAWKNYPVCAECNTLLENGKKFLDTQLNFRFYGLNYYLIPRLLIGSKDILGEIISIMSDSTKTIGLKERIKKRITNDENEILEYLSEKKDVLTFNFLFLRKEQSAERILLMIEDVFPSRIRKIFGAKDYVDKQFNEEFNFGKVRTFFSKSDENKKASDLNKYFLEIVDCVFKGTRVDFSFLLKFYMTVIRKEFINDGYFTLRVKDALMNTVFFENLGLISFEEVEDMEEGIFSSIFAPYGKSFANPAKRGIFLLGVLTQLLLNKQWAERNAKPFIKALKGLKMDEKDIKALLPQVQNKLEEYDSFDKGKRLIASEASTYLLEAGEGWKMSVDEINFYFACGMNLADKVADIAYSEIKKEE